MRHLLRIGSILILCTGLAACFISREALIGPEDAAFPFERLEFSASNGEDAKQTLVHVGDAYRYLTEDEGERYGLVRLKAAGNDAYVVQLAVPADQGEEPVLYALLVPDLAARRVHSYAAVKPDSFVPTAGLAACNREVCVEDLDAYVAYAKGRIADGVPPDVTYEIIAME